MVALLSGNPWENMAAEMPVEMPVEEAGEGFEAVLAWLFSSSSSW